MLRKTFKVIFVLIALTISWFFLFAGVEKINSRYTMFRNTPERTGVFNTDAVYSLNRINWTFKTEDSILSTPMVSRRIIYFGSNDETFYAIDAKTGFLKWRFKAKDDIKSSPAIAAVSSASDIPSAHRA